MKIENMLRIQLMLSEKICKCILKTKIKEKASLNL
jgi:hypothetical protein